MSLADLISMTALLGITAPVREAAAAFGRGDARGKSISTPSVYGYDVVCWCKNQESNHFSGVINIGRQGVEGQKSDHKRSASV